MRPVEHSYPITNPYGRPGNYAAGYHTGVDFGVPVGTKVRAPRRGKVVTASYDSSYGYYVVIQGRRRFRRKRWLLAHLSKRKVRVGQRVRRGQVVGLSGNTGNSTGPHLHAEQRHYPFGYWDHEKPTSLNV